MHPRFDAEFPGAPAGLGVGVGPVAVYVLLDASDWRVRYVGVTRRPELRAAEHFDKTTGNRYLIDWKAGGGDPVFRVVDSADDETWEAVERAWIAYYRSLGFIFNMHEGGLMKRGKLGNLTGVSDPWQLFKNQKRRRPRDLQWQPPAEQKPAPSKASPKHLERQAAKAKVKKEVRKLLADRVEQRPIRNTFDRDRVTFAGRGSSYHSPEFDRGRSPR